MSARMEKTREALKDISYEHPEFAAAALAEVEEWEAREVNRMNTHANLDVCIQQREAAEAERDRLKAALEQIVDESPHNFNARLIARAALGEQT